MSAGATGVPREGSAPRGAAAPATEGSDGLARLLGVKDLVLLALGTVIGSGIFLVPAVVLRQSGGSLGVALLVWLVAGVLSVLGALTYAELAVSRPGAGGLYLYIRDAFGPLPAFLYGWASFAVIATGSLATLAVAFSAYLQTLVPLSPVAAKGAAVLMILTVAVVNVRGTRGSVGVQNGSTLLKVVAIVAMSVALLGRGGQMPPLSAWWPATLPAGFLGGVGLALVGVLWAYEGWQYVTFSAGETVDPQRTFPRGIGVGSVLLVGVYLLANLGYVAALGVPGVMGSERVAAEAMASQFGVGSSRLIAGVILVAMFSASNGLILTTSRLYFAMARDGLFFARLAELHPRRGTPAVAVTAMSVWAAVLALSGTFEVLLTYVVFAGWIFYGLGAASLLVLRRREGAPAGFRVPGYPVTTVLFVLASAGIVGNALVSAPVQGLIGSLMVLSGVPAYWWWRRRGGTGG